MHILERRTAALTKPRNMSLEMYSNIELIVSMGQALIWSGLDQRSSQLLPTEKTFSIGLKSGEYGGRSRTITPAALTLAKATSTWIRALSSTSVYSSDRII